MPTNMAMEAGGSADAGGAVSPHPALPTGTTVSAAGSLQLGGCDVQDLADRFGTPLYVYDLQSLRQALRAWASALGDAGLAHYAGKAYIATWLLREIDAAKLGLDVCSATELELALRAGFPASRIRLHGNNKPHAALERAVRAGISAIVVDNLSELEMLAEIAAQCATPAGILLRLNPGIEAHTHRYLQTGLLDSKFGLPIEGGDARRAVAVALARPECFHLLGYHAHIGTQILELEPYRLLVRRLLSFSNEIEAATGYWPAAISPGGGLGITYTGEVPPTSASWLAALREEIDTIPTARRPAIQVEPGRAIIGPAGVALYRVGTIKAVPGGRTYVSVDGGMADNIRPALYQAEYAALPANRMHDVAERTATIAGPYCESGDILVHDARVPQLQPGDLIALPAAGAYCLPMSSNYNGALRPSVVTVLGGLARLVQRRETLDDLLSTDV